MMILLFNVIKKKDLQNTYGDKLINHYWHIF